MDRNNEDLAAVLQSMHYAMLTISQLAKYHKVEINLGVISKIYKIYEISVKRTLGYDIPYTNAHIITTHPHPIPNSIYLSPSPLTNRHRPHSLSPFTQSSAPCSYF